MSSSDFIDQLEGQLRAASQRRVRLELARVPRVPGGVGVLVVAALAAAAVAVPVLAAHSDTATTRPAGHSSGHGSVVAECGHKVSGLLPADWRSARVIDLGQRCTLIKLPAGPPERVLKGDGIGRSIFGGLPAGVIKRIRALLGERPSRRHFGKAFCGIDGEVDWPGLATFFRHRRFVGYSYGPKISGGGVSGLGTTRGLRVGETIREARRFYGPAFHVSPAQGGSWFIRTPVGRVDGFLSDILHPNSKVLTIEAGYVGCPALTP